MKYFILFVIVSYSFLSCASHKEEDKKTIAKTNPADKFQLATVDKAGVTEMIKLPGMLTAYEEVSIYPKVNGYVKTVLVDIGSRVSKGTLLMVLEAPEMLQASLQAKERYTRTRSDLALDKEHYQRLLEASKTPGAISPFDLSSIKAKVEADSALSNAEKANWQMQQSLLDYLQVSAPFDGVITERNVHPGALVNTLTKDKPMLELKQVSHLRLQVDIPEGMAATIRNKDTVSFFTDALPGKKLSGHISRKSENINSEFRSEKMEVDVANTNGLLTPGMYAQVIFHLSGSRDALSVPKSAVVTSTERKYVLVMKNNKIKKVDITTGNESSSRIEVFGLLQAGDQVIVNANDEIGESRE